LVRQVQEIIAQRNKDDADGVDFAKLTTHELKTREMEQQVSWIRLLLFDFRVLIVYTGRNIDARERIESRKDKTGRDAKIVVPG
jgi:hypothetical protein